MANFLYTYNDLLYSVFIATITSLSLFLNCLLLFVIFTTAVNHLGSYAYLLVLTSVCGITTTLSHATLQPFVHMTSSGFYLFPRRGGVVISGCYRAFQMLSKLNVLLDTICCLLFMATFYQSFLVLAIQFIYRYKAVTRGIGVPDIFSKAQWFLIGIVSCLLYMVTYVLALTVGMTPSWITRKTAETEIGRAYDINFTDPGIGFIVLAVRRINPSMSGFYWADVPFISLVHYICLFGTITLIIAFCIYKTKAAFKSVSAHISNEAYDMHKQLFNALLIQAAISCLLTYAPLSTIILCGPLAGISLGAYGNVLIMTTAISPCVAAFFMLYLIDGYREAVLRIFRLANERASEIEKPRDYPTTAF